MKYLLLLLLCCFGAAQGPRARQGKDYAIFFANDTYPNGWDRLRFPLSDADKIAAELKTNYGFETTGYANKTREEILNLLSEWQRKNYGPDDQLLVFFSGHGHYDPSSCTGYYVPKDGRGNDPGGSSYLEWSSIQNRLNASNCRHLLLMADACFAGTADLKKTCPHLFDPAKGPRDPINPNAGSERDRFINATLRDRSRLYYAAAGAVTTNDRSDFARLFVDALQRDYDRNGCLDMATLRKRLKIAQPTPQFSTFGGNEDAEAFLFIRTQWVQTPVQIPPSNDKAASDLADWRAAKTQNTPTAYNNYLNAHPDGEFRELANAKLQALADEQNRRNEQTAWDIALEKNTTESYAKYRRDYPGGAHFAEAGTKMDALKRPDGMVFVPGGKFTMGSPASEKDREDNDTQHSVTVSAFYMGKYEVTQAEWEKVMGSNPSVYENCDQCPVESVGLDDIQEFLKKLNAQTGKKYRLPTEAEWEYAARGGQAGVRDGFIYAGSNNIKEVAWYNGKVNSKTHPVGGKKANQLGLYDMSGNVSELCGDRYGAYASGAQTDPKGAASGSYSVYRGGGDLARAKECRVAARRYGPCIRAASPGFRLVFVP